MHHLHSPELVIAHATHVGNHGNYLGAVSQMTGVQVSLDVFRRTNLVLLECSSEAGPLTTNSSGSCRLITYDAAHLLRQNIIHSVVCPVKLVNIVRVDGRL